MPNSLLPPPPPPSPEPRRAIEAGRIIPVAMPPLQPLPDTGVPASSLVAGMQRLAEAARTVTLSGRVLASPSPVIDKLSDDVRELSEKLEMREAEIMRLRGHDLNALALRIRENMISLNRILMDKVPDSYAYSSEHKEFVSLIQELDAIVE